MISSETAIPYYTDKDFAAWITKEKFTRVCPENITKYYAIFQHRELCRKKECHACSGLYPTYRSEQDIISGIIHHKKCIFKEQQANERAARLITEKAKIPPAFENITLDNLPKIPKEIKDVLRECVANYVASFPNEQPSGLYIYSEKPGIGKTSVLWIIVRQLLKFLKLSKEFMFFTTTMFMDKLQIDSLTEDHSFYYKACNCGLLVLDDFGDEKRTPIIEKVKSILDYRMSYKRPIILASSVPLDPWIWQGTPDEKLIVKICKVTRIIRLDQMEESDVKGKRR